MDTIAQSIPKTWSATLTTALRHGLIALSSLVAAGLGLLLLGRQPLTVDEAARVAGADDGIGAAVTNALEHNPSTALHQALLGVADAAGLDSTWARLPSLAAVVVATAAAIWLGWQLGGRLAGIAAGGFLAVSSGAIGLAQTVSPHSLALAAALASTAVLVRWRTRGGWPRAVLYALLVVALPLTHPVAAAVLVPHAAYVWLRTPRPAPRALLPACGALGVAGMLLAAAAVDRAGDTGEGDLTLRSLGTALARGAGWNPAVAALAVFAVVMLVWKQRRIADGALLGGAAVAPAVAVLAAGGGLPVFAGDVLGVVAGPLAVAAGVGVSLIFDRRLQIAAASVAAAAAVVGLAWWYTATPAEDWRGAASTVLAGRSAGETVVVGSARAAAAWSAVAPDVAPILTARGTGAWLLLDGAPSDALARGRDLAKPPRYALLEERSFGENLTLQHWLRP